MISVNGLLKVSSLGLTCIAGAAGAHRLVTWAHACDLPNPWRWCQPGDLVMTTCGGLPQEPDEQVAWLVRIAESRVSALVLAPRPGSPPVSDALLVAADERGFAVLDTSFETQFVTLARTVIESAMQTERERLASVHRLYEAHRQALRSGASFDERLTALGRVAGCTLTLVDDETAEDDADCIEIAARGPAYLRVNPQGGRTVDRVLMEHLTGVVASELEQRAAERDRGRRSGTDLLRELFDGRLLLPAVMPELNSRGLTGAAVVCWSSRSGDRLEHADIHHDAALRAMMPLLVEREDLLYGVLPGGCELIAHLSGQLSRGPAAAGVSVGLEECERFDDAARQARLAMRVALDSAQSVVDYGSLLGSVGLLPRSVDEARRLSRQTLGRVVDYDSEHGGELMASLRCFFEHDRKWQRTADDLGVHRQTLAYRLRKVEQLTGIKPTSTAGIARIWVALQALDASRVPTRHSP